MVGSFSLSSFSFSKALQWPSKVFSLLSVVGPSRPPYNALSQLKTQLFPPPSFCHLQTLPPSLPASQTGGGGGRATQPQRRGEVFVASRFQLRNHRSKYVELLATTEDRNFSCACVPPTICAKTQLHYAVGDSSGLRKPWLVTLKLSYSNFGQLCIVVCGNSQTVTFEFQLYRRVYSFCNSFFVEKTWPLCHWPSTIRTLSSKFFEAF